MYKRIFAMLTCLILILSMTACSTPKNVTLTDYKGQKIATASSLEPNGIELSDDALLSYVQTALGQTVQILAQLHSCTEEQAEKKLFSSKYTINTYLDSTAFEAMKNGAAEYVANDVSIAMAATNANGGLIATYGTKETDPALTRLSPHSAFKPLSVYAPAIEDGVINWSTVFEDSPYQLIKTEDGEREWPQNPDGKYSYQPTTVQSAVQHSLNTIAVKCLKKYGVEKSINNLETNFGINCDYEKQQLMQSGEDEIIGNIALGSLANGVSAVDMAGYYQIFANGGLYSQPCAVTNILDSDGKMIFQYKPEQKRIISSQTATVMNRMLSTVVSAEGTAEGAIIPGVDVCGKTGTGDDGNWFIGLTPQYTCSVWHGNELQSNICENIFSKTVSGFNHAEGARYNQSRDVVRHIYCTLCGNTPTGGEKISDGYFFKTDSLGTCKGH